MNKGKYMYVGIAFAVLLLLLVGIGALRTPDDRAFPETSVTLSAPKFSAKSGFYDDAFSLSISGPKKATIYYTTDNTTPTTESAVYTEPLLLQDVSPNPNVAAAREDVTMIPDAFFPEEPVDKCNIIKAIAVDADGNVSPVVTGVYFVGFQNKSGYSGVSIMSLSLEPDDLFDSAKGIYVQGQIYQETANNSYYARANYNQRGIQWERKANLTFFDENGDYVFSQDVGVRTHGNVSRAFVQKSFNLYARAEYSGTDCFAVPFFGDQPMTTAMLRNGGNDDAYYTKIRDVLNQDLLAERDIATQGSIPCVLFLNGEFWGLYNLQERFTADYVEAHYGVDADNVVIWKIHELDYGVEKDVEFYHDLVRFFRWTDFSDDENYRKAGEMLDIQSLIDYVCAEVYIGNTDWPENNYRIWRSRTVSDRPYEDGKWRFMLYDTDRCAALEAASWVDVDSFLPTASGNVMGDDGLIGLLFTRLLQNASFRQDFKNSFYEIAGETFAYDRVHELLYSLADVYAEPMEAYFARFFPESEHRDKLFFYENIQRIDGFYRDRAGYICEYMEQHVDGTYQSQPHPGMMEVLRSGQFVPGIVSFLTVNFELVATVAFLIVLLAFLTVIVCHDLQENHSKRRKINGKSTE